MIAFLSIVFITMVLTAMLSILTNVSKKEHEKIRYDKLSNFFLPTTGGIYQIVFGENPDGDKMSVESWCVYLFCTIMVNIVLLNLLIAILSNTYENVMA